MLAEKSGVSKPVNACTIQLWLPFIPRVSGIGAQLYTPCDRYRAQLYYTCVTGIGAQSFRFSLIDALTVAMENISFLGVLATNNSIPVLLIQHWFVFWYYIIKLYWIYDIVLVHFSACTSMNCLTGQSRWHNVNCIHSECTCIE